MNTPPPLPAPASTRPIQRKVFHKSLKFRLGEITLDYSLIEASHQLAEEWINQSPDIEVVQIQTFHTSVQAITVVWHR